MTEEGVSKEKAVVMVPHAEKAWAWWKSIGSPRWIVAPMVDQSELPFRLLCRANGSEAAWTPMFHSRLFAEDKNYRAEVWSSCPKDRPLIVQFCANDPAYLCKAAKMLEGECDGIDINFGCPQRIAKRGYYGAFLMDNLPLVEKLVKELAESVKVPVTAKIRIFGSSDEEVAKTISYAQMIERAGASLITVHGRTREQKDLSATRADWEVIKKVKESLSIPVVANGNIRDYQDAIRCLDYTGCQGVMSAESLLVDPALFSPTRSLPEGQYNSALGIGLLRDYLQLVIEYPIPRKMVCGHIHKMIGGWLSEHHDLREKVNNGGLSIQQLMEDVLGELERRQKDSGRKEPVPKLTERAAARAAAEREESIKRAREEQDNEEQALKRLDEKFLAAEENPVSCEDCAQ
jgi:tRNA-dihydrouridine synthase 1